MIENLLNCEFGHPLTHILIGGSSAYFSKKSFAATDQGYKDTPQRYYYASFSTAVGIAIAIELIQGSSTLLNNLFDIGATAFGAGLTAFKEKIDEKELQARENLALYLDKVSNSVHTFVSRYYQKQTILTKSTKSG